MANIIFKTLWAALLFINAIAILNEDRFLSRIGWSSAAPQVAVNSYGEAGTGPSVKTKLINLIGAIRMLMPIPLIMCNVIVILYELALGG
ncbi:Predicted membrane protein [Phaffia rhodozyma]|uniref:Predicted membrane protein n=1 Tax=Phaffia rhodozyma TaxID=264483 RepID=A0A0F7SI05_PHARH|nr:Predicted membrane protein [Phaffia rhodozyma]